MTASLGVAAWAPGDDGGDVIRRADRALYRAKESGRDRVVMDEGDRAGDKADDAAGIAGG